MVSRILVLLVNRFPWFIYNSPKDNHKIVLLHADHECNQTSKDMDLAMA